MRRSGRWLVLALVAGFGIGHAAAQTTNDLDIRIERDTRERAAINELGVYHTVTLTERATGQPPKRRYNVFGLARNQQGEQTESFSCSQVRDDDPSIAPGIYNCPIFVDHGGSWEFVAVINEPRAEPDVPPVTVAQAVAPFELETDQVYTGGGDEGPETSAGDVALLWLHVLAAGAWSLCAAAVGALATPALRRRLSALAINRLEWRFDFLVKVSWAMTAAVTGSGLYLLLSETAYETPFSPSELDAVLVLPYARPYYVSLAVKLVLYAFMVVALALLLRGARQQLRLGSWSGPQAATAAQTTRSPWGGHDSSSVTALQAPPALPGNEMEGVRRASLPVAVAGVAVTIGLLGISLCVTLLKYFHQIIEAGSAGSSS